MPLLHPDRKPSAQPRCDRIVEGGGGVMSYHCTLPQGHTENGPVEDREPCYAVEVTPATRKWSDWRERQNARDAADAPPVIECPTCHQHTMVIGRLGGECTNCGAAAGFQAEVPVEEQEQATLEAETPEEAVQADLGQPKQGGFRRVPPEELGEKGIDAQPREMVSTVSTPITCPRHPEITVAYGAECAECGWPRNQQTAQEIEDTDHYPLEQAYVIHGDLPEPSKQREGDQRLPSGGDRPVQDHRIAEEAKRIGLDAQIVTGIMEESKRVGISRYGQVLHTFDGRLNIRDLADELRDALVYVTKLQMTAEADRETLVDQVARALMREDKDTPSGKPSLGHLGYSDIAEIAVDRILDWVLTQRIGPDQVMPIAEAL